MKRLEHTDDVVSALVSSYRSAEVPTPPIDELLAKIEKGQPHPLDESAPSIDKFRSVFDTKAWIAGALGAAVLSGTVLYAVSEDRSPPVAEVAGAHTVATEIVATADRVSSGSASALPSASLPSQDVETLPSVATPPPKPITATAKPPKRPDAARAAGSEAPVSSLRRELELIEMARRALRGGDGSACLSSVERYESEFPAGQFSNEGQVMRIEALALVGSREKAGRLAHEFLQSNPKSPYADRVRSVLGRVGTP
ncbi:MAG: hypothetical protein BGO98_25285 [Myxococcales bacterium 68-20]|nr:MAG: hypothetical protein BGO98_25285 [Myxococcales bacterium 68-20]